MMVYVYVLSQHPRSQPSSERDRNPEEKALELQKIVDCSIETSRMKGP